LAPNFELPVGGIGVFLKLAQSNGNLCNVRLLDTMERLSITVCRKLIAQSGNEPPGDDEIARLRDMLYSLADVIADVFIDLSKIDQTRLEPPNDIDDWLRVVDGGCDVK
jgi:hypothetical protein